VILDTNVLLRALDGDPGAQGQAARARIAQAREDGNQLTVLAATVLEVAYVLESSRAGYGWPRDAVADAITAVIEDPALEVEHADALRTAVAEYRARSVDLHDCLLSAIAAERDTAVLSFDEDLRRMGHHEFP
jgi:predicted nucleic-acid-binding protein